MQMQIFLGFMAIAALIYIVSPTLKKADDPASTQSTQTEVNHHDGEHDHDDDSHEDDHHDHDHHEDAERIQHYEITEPKDVAEAKAIMKEKIEKISTIITQLKLEPSDMESVHEHSYSLEAAIDKIRAEKAAPEAIIDNIDEAIQALHYGSEKHEESTTREWFAKLQEAIKAL